MQTIVITGGHHNSALVVAKELVSRGVKVIWIGHRYSSRGDTHDSAEYIEVTSASIPFHALSAGKLVPNIKDLFRFPLGIIYAIKILKQFRPSAILSFGGYLGGTVALAGKLLGTPIYLHEQTVTAGRANKLIGKLAKQIYLTWGESAKYFPPSKIKVVGLPLREGVLAAKPKTLFTRQKPTLLVMGGKQGAHIINQFIFTRLNDLLNHFNIVHQTGTSSLTLDYEHALAIQSELGSLSDSYLPLGYIGEGQIGTYLHSADFYLGRSGAHICYELAVVGLPALLVPLMSTHDAEQYKNATILVSNKQALILPSSKLTLQNFLSHLAKLRQLTPVKQSLPTNATTLLVNHLLSELV